MAEASVVGIPDALKGQLPFAFVDLRDQVVDNNSPATPTREMFNSINGLVREQIGAIASLGGIIQGRGMIPRTRSGKALRLILRHLVENGVQGKYDEKVNVPSTTENLEAVEVARVRVKKYFEERKQRQSQESQARL